MKKIIILVLALAISSISFAQSEFAKHFKIWLGNWEMKTPNGITIESWALKNETSFSGKTVLINIEGDSIIQETIELINLGNQILYLPRVKNQNNNQAISFNLVEFNDKYFVFENKKHDFPQRISYEFLTEDSLIATIEGVKNKIRKKINYSYKKIK